MTFILGNEAYLTADHQANAERGHEFEADEQAFRRWAETMSDGHYEAGWQINDVRGCHWPSAHRLWNGLDLDNCNINVRSLHGFGDAVQMLRYAPHLLQVGRSVRFEVPEELQVLMPYFNGVSQSARTCTSHNAEIEMMELPYFFRTQPSELPLQTKYLVLPTEILERVRSTMGPGGRRRIGVAWAGGEWDRDRWIPFQMLRRLICKEQFEWWNLQGYPAMADAADSPLITNSDLCDGGLLGLAAIVASLDLVLTVDTLAAHIAGALGIPTWLMLKHEADWRWMTGRSDSPWYPALRIFRQTAPGVWKNVIEEVEGALSTLA